MRFKWQGRLATQEGIIEIVMCRWQSLVPLTFSVWSSSMVGIS